MEEIRKQRKVRGIAGALRGCARPEGWSFGMPSLLSHEHKPQTVGETISTEGGFGRDQDAASLLTTWIVRRFPQPRATLR